MNMYLCSFAAVMQILFCGAPMIRLKLSVSWRTSCMLMKLKTGGEGFKTAAQASVLAANSPT